jgi:hypothetical protein
MSTRAPRGRHEEAADRAGARAAAGRDVGTVAAAAPAELERPDPALRAQIGGSLGGGRPLPGGIRASMERAFGAGFGAVRLHVDSHAGRMAEALGASAFTTGSDVFIHPGAYEPGSTAGRALLGHELTHVVQQGGHAAGGVQYNRPEDYTSWAEAKAANRYSKALLDQQSRHKMSSHISKGFSDQERANVLEVNRQHYGVLKSDDPPHRRLYVRDTTLIPHIDHRFPAVSGGSNSYANAMVLSGHANMSKNAKLVVSSEPAKPLPPYRALFKNEPTPTPFMGFSAPQRKAILDANRAYYGVGAVIDDADGETVLEDPDPERVPNVDHITPQSDAGSSYYFNAAVIGSSANVRKGGKRNRLAGSWDSDESDNDPDARYGDEELNMTLAQFITYRYEQAQAHKHRPGKKEKKKGSSESESDSDSGTESE